MSTPAMRVYDEDSDGPSMLVRLPVTVVETLIDISHRLFTPAMGLDEAFTDELRAQLAVHSTGGGSQSPDEGANTR